MLHTNHTPGRKPLGNLHLVRWVQPGSAGFSWVTPRFRWVTPRFSWVQPGSAGFSWVQLGSAGFNLYKLRIDKASSPMFRTFHIQKVENLGGKKFPRIKNL